MVNRTCWNKTSLLKHPELGSISRWQLRICPPAASGNCRNHWFWKQCSENNCVLVVLPLSQHKLSVGLRAATSDSIPRRGHQHAGTREQENEATYFMRMFAMQQHAVVKKSNICLLILHTGPFHVHLGFWLTGLHLFHMVATYQIKPRGGISASDHPLTSFRERTAGKSAMQETSTIWVVHLSKYIFHHTQLICGAIPFLLAPP